MKKIFTTVLFVVATLIFLPSDTLATEGYMFNLRNPDGYNTIFFETNLLDRHSNVFVEVFITDQCHMEWLIAEYDRLFDNDWQAYDMLRKVIFSNLNVLHYVDIDELTRMTVEELRNTIMYILYSIDVYELGLDDFVGGLRWSVYNINQGLTIE